MIVTISVDLLDNSPVPFQQRVAHALEEHAKWLRQHEADVEGEVEPDIFGTQLRWTTTQEEKLWCFVHPEHTPDELDLLRYRLNYDDNYLVVTEEDAASLRQVLRDLEEALRKTEEPTLTLLEDLRNREPWLPSAT